jgi:hypothetical protein
MLGFKGCFNARRVVAGVELVHKIIKGQFGLPESFGTDLSATDPSGLCPGSAATWKSSVRPGLSKAGMSWLAFTIHSHACAVKILSVSGNALVPALLTKKILFEPYFGLGRLPI